MDANLDAHFSFPLSALPDVTRLRQAAASEIIEI
jgi:hypothetical protein